MANENVPDTGWGFPPQFLNKGKDVVLVAEEDDIKEALNILFSTAVNERLNYPAFGCDLKRFMFEPVDRLLAVEIQKMIAEAIYSYEPRIQVRNIEVTESDDNAHQLLVRVDYVIKTSDKRDNIVYTLSVF